MNITKLSVKKLYGYMNKDIDFNKDINLLVGINGSGKTSILNLINWMLIPSLANLCLTEYEEIVLSFTYQKKNYILVSKQSEYQVDLSLFYEDGQEVFSKVHAKLKIPTKEVTMRNELKARYVERYTDLVPDDSEKKLWDFLNEEIPNPIVIGLDRNLYTEEGDEFLYSDSVNSKRILKKRYRNDVSPLEKVIELARVEYGVYRNRLIGLNKKLNNKIMLSSFDESLTKQNISKILDAPHISINQVESLEKKVKDYFEENANIDFFDNSNSKRRNNETIDKIDNYFSNLKDILRSKKDSKSGSFDILYITNINQFEKIKDLIKEFESFEHTSKRLFLSIEEYLITVNKFFKDTSKELYFDKDTSKMRFKILDKLGKVVEKDRDIETLSSGEKQILILFTYIKFNSKNGKIFIIDEPELSLHPKWQEMFLDGIKNIMPKNTQLLFATHSPAIVGRNKAYCKVLLPY